ncbi:contact-dependent growth inhibition system immunity protein [Dyella sp. 20L07]|uniref:contact-dependent growth inhibition system immunity protein n=1 Tax=Dyella sp. 20L07 TaxID=3384240 RepID=UPI003D28776B
MKDHDGMTLENLDPTLVQRQDLGSGLSERAKALRGRTLAELSPGEIAFCLRQSIALPHTIPLAMDLVIEQPLIHAELYPGDMLLSLLHVSKLNALSVSQSAELHDICSAAVAGAETIAESVVPAAKGFMDFSRDS